MLSCSLIVRWFRSVLFIGSARSVLAFATVVKFMANAFLARFLVVIPMDILKLFHGSEEIRTWAPGGRGEGGGCVPLMVKTFKMYLPFLYIMGQIRKYWKRVETIF